MNGYEARLKEVRSGFEKMWLRWYLGHLEVMLVLEEGDKKLAKDRIEFAILIMNIGLMWIVASLVLDVNIILRIIIVWAGLLVIGFTTESLWNAYHDYKKHSKEIERLEKQIEKIKRELDP